jgi:hypothetical protein
MNDRSWLLVREAAALGSRGRVAVPRGAAAGGQQGAYLFGGDGALAQPVAEGARIGELGEQLQAPTSTVGVRQLEGVRHVLSVPTGSGEVKFPRVNTR